MAIKETVVTNIINGLKEIDVDGETMELIIVQLGLDKQMLRQLALKATNNELSELIGEKNELAKPKKPTRKKKTWVVNIVRLQQQTSGIEIKAETLEEAIAIANDTDEEVFEKLQWSENEDRIEYYPDFGFLK